MLNGLENHNSYSSRTIVFYCEQKISERMPYKFSRILKSTYIIEKLFATLQFYYHETICEVINWKRILTKFIFPEE